MNFYTYMNRPTKQLQLTYTMEFKRAVKNEIRKLEEKLKRKRFQNKEVLNSKFTVAKIDWDKFNDNIFNELEEAIEITLSVKGFNQLINNELKIFCEGVFYFSCITLEFNFKELANEIRYRTFERLKDEKENIRVSMDFKARGINNENKYEIITQKYMYDDFDYEIEEL